METSTIAILSLGFVYGLRHALDPDHLVAVSTIVSEQKSLARSSLIGTFWGLGHTTSLLTVGLAVLLLKTSIPRHVELWFELAVAGMLVTLGAGVLLKLARRRGLELHIHSHSHNGGPAHSHLHLHNRDEHQHRHHLFRVGRKPFVVGLVHGMAGSAALTLAVLATIPSVTLGLVYIGVFGLGSVGGMLLMSAMVGLPFAFTSRHFSTINTQVRVVAGLLSVAFGLGLGWNLLREMTRLGE